MELGSNDCLKSRMREIRTYGSVRGSRQAFHCIYLKGVSRLSTRRKAMVRYEEEFKKRIVRMHLEEGRTIKSLSEDTMFPRTGSGTGLRNIAKNAQKILLQRKNTTS